MARGEVAEREGSGALQWVGAKPGGPCVGRGPWAARKEMEGQAKFLPRPQGEEEVVGEAEAEYSVIL